MRCIIISVIAEFGFEGRLAADHLEERHAQRVLVGAGVGRLAADQLGRQVEGGAHHGAGGGVGIGANDLDDAEIHQDGLVVDVDHDVGGLDIAVDEAAAVGVTGCLGDVAGIGNRLLQGQLAPGAVQAAQALLQRLAGHELLHHVVQVLVVVEVEDLHDVRVAQLGDGGGFLLEAGDELGIARQVRVDHLDRHDALQVGVVGFVDGRHTALPEQLVDAVAPAERLTGH